MYNIEEIKNTIICGDCLEEMKKIPDNSIDSIVTDPPAGINFMGKTWDDFTDIKNTKSQVVSWMNSGVKFSNKGLFAFQDFIYQVFSEAIRILKPGGHALVWALPRTSHHTAMGIERAGFEIRDKIYFVFGSGFPKSLNIGKAVDKLQGNKRETVGTKRSGIADGPFGSPEESRKHIFITKGNSPYEGWGTALKPAVEEWILARKPISEKNIAKNVLKWGTGGLNIDGCRVEAIDQQEFEKNWTKRKASAGFNGDKTGIYGSGKTNMPINYTPTGRFPSHLILDGSEEVRECFPDSKSGNGKANIYKKYGGHWGKGKQIRNEDYGDSGSASRFFMKCEFDNVCPFCYTWCKDIKKEIICQNNNKSVPSVENNSGNINQITESIALKNVMENQNAKLVQLVKFAGNLCDLCGTYIVQKLVEIKNLASKNEESQAIQDFIGDYRKCILLQNLVNYVEKLDNIDTTPTTQNLLKLFGYVIPAITNYIQKIENSAQKRLIYTSKASKKERDMGLEEFEIVEVRGGGGRVKNGYNDNDPEQKRLKNAAREFGAIKTAKHNIHPTVKPLSLMRYLCRLITPPKGIVLDMFAGSGSTLIAAKQEGFNFIGIEQEKDYIEIAEARLKATPTPML